MFDSSLRSCSCGNFHKNLPLGYWQISLRWLLFDKWGAMNMLYRKYYRNKLRSVLWPRRFGKRWSRLLGWAIRWCWFDCRKEREIFLTSSQVSLLLHGYGGPFPGDQGFGSWTCPLSYVRLVPRLGMCGLTAVHSSCTPAYAFKASCFSKHIRLAWFLTFEVL